MESRGRVDEAEAKEKRDQTKHLGTFKAVREAAKSRMEKQYLYDLMLSTKGDIKEACSISGLFNPACIIF